MSLITFGVSVPGSAHVRGGMPCQDASGHLIKDTGQACAFVVADGHGDISCPRSETGARLAVDIMLREAQSLMRRLDGHRRDMSAQGLASGLKTRVVGEWRRRVLDDYARRPLSLAEREPMDERSQKLVADHPDHLYGTTLVAGVSLDRVLVLLQQGDGCCVVFDEDGLASFPVPADERCVGNMTTSLCDVDADARTRTVVIDTHSTPVSACLVATDGLDKSLMGADGLIDYCADVLLAACDEHDPKSYARSLASSLAEVSACGAGDDVSLAGFIDKDRVQGFRRRLLLAQDMQRARTSLARAREKVISMQRRRDFYLRTPAADEGEREERERYCARYDEVVASVGLLERTCAALEAELSGAAVDRAFHPASVSLDEQATHVQGMVGAGRPQRDGDGSSVTQNTACGGATEDGNGI